ncbi:MAG: ComEC/Rec2 family competence protein [Clostridium sp.]|nr:ComEC/Rec2 family competence protein [Clostridium sp.]
MKRLFAFVGFTVAITLILLNILPFYIAKIILPVLAVLLLASLFIKNVRQAKVLPIVLGSAVFACLIFMVVTVSTVAPISSLDGKTAAVTFDMIDIPAENDSGYTYVVKTKKINIDNAPQNIKLKLKSSEKIKADYYADMNGYVQFYVNDDNPFSAGNAYGDGIFINARLIDYEVINDSCVKNLNYYIIHLREYIFSVLGSLPDDDAGALSIALITGDKSGISEEIYNQFKIAGFTHFMAVSGFHISFICMGLYGFLKWIGCGKRLNVILTVITAVLYCGIADFSKSVIRSVIMIVVMLLAKLLHSKSDPLNSLGFAVFILCLNPFAVTDASALMTVSAVLGILLIATPLNEKVKVKNKFAKYFLSAIVTGASVLAALLPAFYLYFGSFSLISILTNLVMEPIVCLLIFFSIVLCFVSGIWKLGVIPAAIIHFLSEAVFSFTDFCAENLSFLYVGFSDKIFGIMLAIIFAFLGVILIVMKKIPIRLTAILVSLIMAVTSSLAVYQFYTSAQIIITDDGCVMMRDKDSSILVGLTNKYDYGTADLFVRNKSLLLIDSADYAAGRGMNADLSKLSSDNFSCRLCENMAVEISSGEMKGLLYDKDFKITDDYVIIDGNTFERNSSSRYDDTEDIVISFSKGTALSVDYK